MQNLCLYISWQRFVLIKYMSWGPKLHVLRKSKQVNFEAITTRLFQTILKVLLLVLYINQHKQWKPYRDTIFLIFFKEKTYDCCFKSQHTGIPPCLTSYNNLSKQRSSQISSKKLALFGSIFHRFGISLQPPCALLHLWWSAQKWFSNLEFLSV